MFYEREENYENWKKKKKKKTSPSPVIEIRCWKTLLLKITKYKKLLNVNSGEP